MADESNIFAELASRQKAETEAVASPPNIFADLVARQNPALYHGADMDNVFSGGTLGRVLGAFGQGASDGWGAGTGQLSEDTTKFLRKAGVYNDYEAGQNNLFKELNEALFRPVVSHTLNSLEGGYKAGAAQFDTAKLFNPEAAAASETNFAGDPEAAGAAAASTAMEPAITQPAGAFKTVLHAAERGVVPAVGGLAGAGAGAEAGGALGVLGGPFAPITVPLGAVVGGIAGGLGGSYLAGKAQDAALEELPDSVKEAVGQDKATRGAELKEHPYLAQGAELAPNLLFAGPGAVAREVAEGASALARVGAHPLTARVVGAGLMGGQETASELVQGQPLDPGSIAVAAGAGALMTKPTALGHAVTELGASPMRAVLPEPPRSGLDIINEARALGVVGEGEAGYQGTVEPPIGEGPRADAIKAAATNERTFYQSQAEDRGTYLREATPEEATGAPPASEQRAPSPEITQDVSRQLQAAGRPAEEADAAGALIASHYETRAARFEGAKGTAEELYKADAPRIEQAPVSGPPNPAWTDIVGHLRSEDEVSLDQSARTAQGRERGKILLKDGETTIQFFRSADASTFIHETGHAWLEELMHDAEDEAAPQSLKDDAAAVHEWLGTTPGEPISGEGYDSPHEKFARGFETYLREGRAPSRALAEVFGKFKDWLTQIYRTVTQLKSPITDDIRGVFDRMISTPERPTTIGEAADNIGTRHETLVGHTLDDKTLTTEPLTKIGDHLQEEQNARIEHGPVAADLNELIAEHERGRQARGGATEDVGPDGTPATPEPTGDTNAAEPTGTVGGGNTEAAPESGSGAATTGTGTTGEQPTGDAGSTGEQAAPGGPERPQPAPGTEPPTATLPRTGGRLTDKDGVIQVKNIASHEDVTSAIRQAAERRSDPFAVRRNRLSDAEVQGLAESLGVSPHWLNRRRIGQTFTPTEIEEARKLLGQSSDALKEAAGIAADGRPEAQAALARDSNATPVKSEVDSDVRAYAEAVDRHTLIQNTILGRKTDAETGRLSALAEVEGQKPGSIQDATSRTAAQLQEEARAFSLLDTTQKIGKYAVDIQKVRLGSPGYSDWVLSYFINALISGPMTHGTYLVGNEMLALSKAIPETAAGAAAGRIREAFGWDPGGTGERMRLAEVKGSILGFLDGNRQGVRAAWDAGKLNETRLLPSESPSDQAVQGHGKGAIPNPMLYGHEVPIGKFIELPSRGVTVIHTLSRTLGYTQEISSLSERIARNEGLTGDALAARINDLKTNPTETMMQQAVAEANNMAFMRKPAYDSFAAKISSLVNHPVPLGALGVWRPLKFIDPFVTIGNNVFDQALMKRTPLGWMSPAIRDDLMGRNGGVAFDRAVGRMVAGTSFMLAMGGLAAEGLVTGSGPADAKQRQALIMTGWQPHSIKIGDMYYSFNRLGVPGMLAGIAADMYEVGHAAATEDMGTVAAMAAHAFGHDVLDESFMHGPGEMLKAIEDSDRYGPTFAHQLVSSFVPFSVGMGQIAHTVDPYTRETRTMMDTIMSKIPYLSEELEPRRDIWGEPIPNKDSLAPGMLAIYESRINTDPVNRALLGLSEGSEKYFPAQPQRKIRGVKLEEDQYDDYTRLAGRMAKQQLDLIVGMPGFESYPPGIQHDIISKAIRRSRMAAESLVMMQYPAIIEQSMAAKLAHLTGEP